MIQPKRLPTGIGNFKTIRQENYLYIDKTEQLLPLIRDKGFKYFLSRPRRFGKSLTVSTLESLLLGKKELFKGLWIYDKWNWTPHSVIRFDFSQMKICRSESEFLHELKKTIFEAAKVNDFAFDMNDDWDISFFKLLCHLRDKGQVAILIDEYDAPFHKILDENEDIQKIIKLGLRDFYLFLKSKDILYDFMFITGITKIAQTSIFSGLNMLTDISLEPPYAALCGITQSELESNFSAHIDQMAAQKKQNREKVLENLKTNYNGYRFSDTALIRVYNPFSLINAFDTGKIENFWFRSGTPTLLINLIRKNKYNLSFLDSPKVTIDEVKSTHKFEDMSLENLLYQTGYLTIGNVQTDSQPENASDNSSETTFDLIYPNKEVKRSFLKVLLNTIRHHDVTPHENKLGKKIVSALKTQQWSEFAKGWNELLTYIPFQHHIPQESYYHSLFMIFAALNGLDAQSERMTSIGKMDVAIEFEDMIYVIEFKLNTSESAALKQIHTKKYYDVFLRKEKPITLIGIAFDSKKKCISEILAEDMLPSQKASKAKKVYSISTKSKKKTATKTVKKPSLKTVKKSIRNKKNTF